MTEWSDGFKLAVTAIVLVVVVAIVFSFVYLAQNSANEGEEKLATEVSGFSEKEYSQYNETTLTGSVVATAIERYVPRDDINVTLVTKMGNKNYNSSTDTFGEIYNKGDNLYVNPAGKFKSTITRDANGVVNRITFTQQ